MRFLCPSASARASTGACVNLGCDPAGQGIAAQRRHDLQTERRHGRAASALAGNCVRLAFDGSSRVWFSPLIARQHHYSHYGVTLRLDFLRGQIADEVMLQKPTIYRVDDDLRDHLRPLGLEAVPLG